jgi:Tfp pilus assembly protein PilF
LESLPKTSTTKAIAMYEKALAIEGQDYDTQIRLAIAYSVSGDDAKANTVYEKMIEQFPGSVTPWINLGYNYLKEGKPGNAETFLLKAKAMENTDYSNMNAGHVYLVKGDVAKAQECYEEGLSLAPNAETYIKDMQNDYTILQQYGIAQDNYEELIQKLKRPVKAPAAH